MNENSINFGIAGIALGLAAGVGLGLGVAIGVVGAAMLLGEDQTNDTTATQPSPSPVKERGQRVNPFARPDPFADLRRETRAGNGPKTLEQLIAEIERVTGMKAERVTTVGPSDVFGGPSAGQRP